MPLQWERLTKRTYLLVRKGDANISIKWLISACMRLLVSVWKDWKQEKMGVLSLHLKCDVMWAFNYLSHLSRHMKQCKSVPGEWWGKDLKIRTETRHTHTHTKTHHTGITPLSPETVRVKGRERESKRETLFSHMELVNNIFARTWELSLLVSC